LLRFDDGSAYQRGTELPPQTECGFKDRPAERGRQVDGEALLVLLGALGGEREIS